MRKVNVSTPGMRISMACACMCRLFRATPEERARRNSFKGSAGGSNATNPLLRLRLRRDRNERLAFLAASAGRIATYVIRENVEDVRIVVPNVAGAVVAQEMVELVFGLRQEGVSAPIDDIKTLAGVRVVEAKMVFLVGGGGA